MMKKTKTLTKMVDSGVVAIIRTETGEEAEQIAKACISGGIRAVEVTYTVPGVTEVIRSLKESFHEDEFIIGAGSVLDSETARIAILAGAEYIVAPCFDADTAKLCNRYQVPYIPGCMTLTEIKTALEYGVEIIKLFPGNIFEPSMIKAIHGPLPQASIMPTGGINLQNAGLWIKNGAVAIGVGSELTKSAKEGNYEEVTRLASEFCRVVQESRR